MSEYVYVGDVARSCKTLKDHVWEPLGHSLGNIYYVCTKCGLKKYKNQATESIRDAPNLDITNLRKYNPAKDVEYLEKYDDPLAKEILFLRDTISMLEKRTKQKIESLDDPVNGYAVLEPDRVLISKRELKKYFEALYKNILTQ